MKKSLIVFGIVYLLLIVVGVTAFGSPRKNHHRTYDCKLVGVQKVKPYNFKYFKNIRHFGYITGSKSKHKLRS